MALSDIEATDYALEQAILASSLQAQGKRRAGEENEKKLSPFQETADSIEFATVSEPLSSEDEYPEFVQELVMNGFLLQDVLRARDLVGDDFDTLLAFLFSRE